VSNLEESIKLYAISLQADIAMNTKISKKYNKDYQNNKFVDIESRKEILMRKLDEIERRQLEILKTLPKTDESNANSLLNDFEQKAYTTNKEVEDIIEDVFSNYIYKKTKKMTFEVAIEYFKTINSKEKEVGSLIGQVGNLKINFDINKRFDNMYNIIEKAVDHVLENEFNFNTLEGVNDKSLLNLETIKELKNNVNNKNDTTNIVATNETIIKENKTYVQENNNVESIYENKTKNEEDVNVNANININANNNQSRIASRSNTNKQTVKESASKNQSSISMKVVEIKNNPEELQEEKNESYIDDHKHNEQSERDKQEEIESSNDL
jgi:hypothetical protein